MPPPPGLPADVRAALSAGGGLLSADYDGPGLSRSRLHRLARRGALIGVAKGVYADAAALTAADPWSAAGLPPSLSNVWVGEYMPEARLDHYWPEFRVGAEGDGMAKYLIADPAAAIRKEKQREWLLQRMGIRLVRYTWATATSSPDILAGRVRELLEAAHPSSCGIRTWPRDEGLGILGLASGRPRH